MATVSKKVCDRCAQEIKYVGWTAKLKNVSKKGKRINILKICDGNPSGYGYVESCYELCADCTKEFKKFLSNVQ